MATRTPRTATTRKTPVPSKAPAARKAAAAPKAPAARKAAAAPKAPAARKAAVAPKAPGARKAPASSARMRRLVTSALSVRQRAYAPYSQFQVGAAVLGDDGRIYAGCNVENSSYGLCLCAERNAMGQAIARGARKILAAAVVAPSARPSPPCGMCLQAFAELSDGDIPILLANPDGEEEELLLSQLLPHQFDRTFLPRKRS